MPWRYIVSGTPPFEWGDRLRIEYVPTNYSRDAVAGGVERAIELAAHLAGIDAVLTAAVPDNLVTIQGLPDNLVTISIGDNLVTI